MTLIRRSVCTRPKPSMRRAAGAAAERATVMARSAVAIDDAYATDDAVVPAGAAVAIIPPVSGG